MRGLVDKTMPNTIYLKGMDTFKFVLLVVLIIIIGFAGSSDSACDSKCLNSTTDPAGLACNETTGECLYGCVAGFTGPGCQLPCGENCLNCNVSSSAGSENETECNLCSPNYFKNGSHCESCNANCHANSSSTISVCNQTDGACMNGCINGFYGLRCDIRCSATCRQNETLNGTLCRQNDGSCESGCLEGYYGDKCNLNCSYGCSANDTSSLSTCSQGKGHCDFGCNDGYYTAACNETCSEFCLQDNTTDDRFCNQTSGHCNFGCIDGYYGSKCSISCSTGCANNTNSSLPVCDAVDGRCNFGCDNSSYNAQCSGTCSLHCLENTTPDVRACNETNGQCEFGCENGYYGVMCDKMCSNNCRENSTSVLPICDQHDGSCTFGCEDHFGKPKCDKKCENVCLDALCEQHNYRICSTGCRFNFYGKSCDKTCSVGCIEVQTPHCHQNGTCKGGCKSNFWGSDCIECNEGCIRNASNNETECNSTDGFCLLGCQSGKYGIICSDNCPANCKGKTCEQIGGRCVHKCIKGFFGEYCNSTCSRNCGGLEKICFPENGTCVAETCEKSWFGPRCEEKCPRNCMNQICQRNSGICSNCIAGYFGDTCNTECLKGTFGTNCDTNCSVGCENSTCDREDGNCRCIGSYIGSKCDTLKQGPGDAKVTNEPVISGSVGGAALILLIIGTVILCVWRRKKEEEFVRRRKPKNRKALSEIIRKSIFSKSIAGPKRILIDNLLKRVMDMSESDFETEFNDIESTSANKPVSEAKKAENLSKNCFVDVYPYDENRVVLRSLSLLASGKEIKAKYRKTMDIITGLADLTEDDPDYINASFIEGYAGAKQRYIAAQAPISATVKDFWKMVIQEKVSVIVMMTEYETKGLFKKYWPDVDKTDEYHNGDIKIHGVKEEVFADFCLRTLKIEWFSESRQIKHLQFTSWPSEGIPSSSAAMIEFYHKFRSIEPDEATPIVIHCTSGAGRTGCFIALDLSVDEGEEDHSVDVSMCVTRLREQRIHMVQSESQYEFLYKTIAQVLSLRSYPVDKDKLKKEWKAMKKDDDKLHKTFEDIKESVTMDFTDYESISKNGEYTDKNREGSDIPEDEYRPTLPNDEYINAVYINTYKKKNGMIVTQMPTPDTVDAFLRLICQERCHTIVMMNDENFDDETQCKYWPKYNTSSKHRDIFVTTTEIMDVVNYLRIKLSLSDLAKEDDPNNKFTVTLYQISTWKDGNACPKNEVSCLSLVREVLRETADSNEGNILVHCLNGSERSGLFASLYILLEKLNYEKDISVVNTVRQIKTRRPTAIPNQEQFHFIYDCLVSYIENYSIEIKFIPEGRPKKQSRASVMYSIPDKKKRSDLYAKPDKKKKGSADIYSKPDKRRKASSSDGAASGSGTNKKKNRKTSSKDESKDTVVSIEDTTDVTILVDGDAADKAVKKTVEDSSADLDNTHTNGGMNPRISND